MDMLTRLFSSASKSRTGRVLAAHLSVPVLRSTHILLIFVPISQLLTCLSVDKYLSDSEGFLGATDSAVPCAQMLNLAHAMDRDLKEDKNGASHKLDYLLFWRL